MNDPRNFQALPSGSRPNLVVRIVTGVMALAVLALSVFLGAMVFLAILGLSLIVAVVFSVRLWWLRRQFMAEQRRRRERGEAPRSDEGASRRNTVYVIEGRYRRDE